MRVGIALQIAALLCISMSMAAEVTNEQPAEHDTATAARETLMAAEQEKMNAQFTQEQAAQKTRMKEEEERHDAQMRAYLESQGIQLPRGAKD